MASTSHSSSFSSHEPIRELVSSINNHLSHLISDTKTRKLLSSKCRSNLTIQNKSSFEFSEQSIISNLYWGIEAAESAIEFPSEDDCESRLKSSERMLQVPALLSDDHGLTAGIDNGYLICCSYFYLSIIWILQNDEWQAAIHFLQSLVVNPRIVFENFAPELCRCILFLSSGQGNSGRVDFEELRSEARRYKAWLTYYRVMAFGEANQQVDLSEESSRFFRNMNSSSIVSSGANGQEQSLSDYHDFEKIHSLDHGEKLMNDIVERSIDSTGIQESEMQICSSTCLDKCSKKNVEEVPRRKRLQVQDILQEYQSDTPMSEYSTDLENDGSSEEYADDYESSGRTLTIDADETLAKISNKSRLELDLIESNAIWSDKEDSQHYNHTDMQNYQLDKSPFEISSRFQESGILEKVIAKLCFAEETGWSEEDYTVEITKIYETLTSRKGIKYSLLKDVILDQLLVAISTSKEDGIVRASVAILTTIISTNKSVITQIKQKGLQLFDLASALRRNVHEAAILIYLINPTPDEIVTLELLPILVEVICNSKSYKVSLTPVLVTPPAASLMIIEVLVTAFDYETNNNHLAAITSPRVLCGILNIPTNNNIEEVISLASVLVRCMKFDGECRTYLSQSTPLAPFISLLVSSHNRAIFVALEFFHEILRIPRSSAISLLQQMIKTGNMNNICVLVLLIQQSEAEYKLLAANLFLQLDMLGKSSSNNNTIHREAAVEALFESLTCEDHAQLSASILSNLGGTYSWTGEPYTVPWLLRKAGLNSLSYKNMIKNVDWSNQSLQDGGIEAWSGKMARRIIKVGDRVFIALEKGLKNKSKSVSRDCLTAIAWLGCEIVRSSHDVRTSACEILLSTLEEYLHPGLELEERLLACFCIYNYASGRGMQKLIHFSEGVRESLRRLSNITWMAEELLKVADYLQPNKWRISCVHTQVLEVGFKNSGAVTGLVYYRGHLCSGYADGSIKVWDVIGTTTTLISNIKEHRKAVTCFSLYEPGNLLLSGSADKTIRIWRIAQRKLECIEVITTKETIKNIGTSGGLIFATTQSHKLKVFDESRKEKEFYKNKNVKCIKVTQGKVYIGCTDSSIQELVITSNRHVEIKVPTRSWMKQNKSINSIAMYKDWLYSASAAVEGSHIRDWRKNGKPQKSIIAEKRGNVVAMRVVEDFIYLLSTSSPNNLQIWLRGTHNKVGRIAVGNKITSLLAGNDMILCGTDTGLIKGWIPL